MQQFLLRLVAAALCTGLAACDIQPVSVGSWQTQTDLTENSLQATWTITVSETLQSTGQWSFSAEQVELDGSRIAFSGQIPLASGSLVDGNFSGTVSGNSLQGTFYTTAGNFTVSGQRQ
ncbi:MAG: hypothetical protein ACI95C_000765 [Pseudohongiellaceae bacterium]|jgi:hypothetical protein